MELVDFLRARYDEDERIAEEAGGRRAEWRLARPLDDAELGDASWLRPRELRHAERHDPARILAEVEAKRQIIRAYAEAEFTLSVAGPNTPPHDLMTGATNSLKRTLRLLARAHRTHRDFDPAWLED